jgi:tRNA(Arg) A34 adenosine deaminase TadA
VPGSPVHRTVGLTRASLTVMTTPLRIELELPAWVPEFLDRRPGSYPTREQQVELVLDLAREHVVQGTGGPFTAGVFSRATGALVAVGVNLVVPGRACIAHAEVVALALAGQARGSFHLGDPEPTSLVASTEPCAMCLGAFGWSGCSELTFGALDEDARAIGFDEGVKPIDWIAGLTGRGVDVHPGVRRDDARDVLQQYVAAGGRIYNGTGP